MRKTKIEKQENDCNKLSEIEKEFKEFWIPIIFNGKNGRLNLDQLKKELYDFSCLMDNVSKVYYEITNGKISKVLTDPDAVISEYENCVNDLVDEAHQDECEECSKLDNNYEEGYNKGFDKGYDKGYDESKKWYTIFYGSRS